jgi:hypothetical protein
LGRRYLSQKEGRSRSFRASKYPEKYCPSILKEARGMASAGKKKRKKGAVGRKEKQTAMS